jgi:S-adenosylmethionine decarboxylase
MTGFGPHLTIDAKNCKPGTLSDLNLIFEVFFELPKLVGMTPISQPHIFPYEGLVPEDKGITASQIIAESHISLHTFSEKDYFFFDIFSCKPFDTDIVIKYIQEKFEPKEIVTHLVERGLDFPR